MSSHFRIESPNLVLAVLHQDAAASTVAHHEVVSGAAMEVALPE